MRINIQALNQVQEDLGNFVFRTANYNQAFKKVTDIPFSMEVGKDRRSLSRDQLALSMEYLLEGKGDQAYQLLEELEDKQVETLLQTAYKVAREKGYLPTELRENQEEFTEHDYDVIQDYDNLGDLLRNLRKESGLTQEEVASKIPISRNYLSELENNRRMNPSDRVLYLFYQVYKVDWRALKYLREHTT